MALIWIHALAALLLCAVALMQARNPTQLLPGRALVTALGFTALWALAIAGIGAADMVTRVLESARNLAWLAVLAAMARSGPKAPPLLAGVFVVTAACMMLPAALAVAELVAERPVAVALLRSAAAPLRMLGAVAGLVLAHRVALVAEPRSRGGRRILVGAVALIWSADFMVHLLAWLLGDVPGALRIARGIVMATVAPLIAAAVQRDGDWTLRVSRTLALQSAALAGAALYVILTLVAGELLRDVAGVNARVAQTAFVFGTAAALATLASTPWLRAWTKVVLAKHLFSHRYDYRAEWVRFTATLGGPGDAARLEERVIKAVADLTESAGGLLLATTHSGTLEGAAAWRCAPAPSDAAANALAEYLGGIHRIIELDAVRAGTAPAPEIAVVPAWLIDRAEAWAIVPLIHVERLVGVLVLARPPIDRALDWEDFDLLGITGRQVASYLAEDRAHAALADARRFEEFNRRFAFIMHDLKNLVSQTALVARNAERHAENPEFRADMIATLKDSSQRMTALLARLGQQAPAPEPARAVPLAPLLRRIADARLGQDVTVVADVQPVALADPAALETLLRHLVQNALEASEPGDPVTLALARDHERAVVEVIDRGCGMTAAFVRDELFRPFASTKANGFGLGAFEARQLAHAMGGTLEVTSRVGEGTRFRLRLPLVAALEQAA